MAEDGHGNSVFIETNLMVNQTDVSVTSGADATFTITSVVAGTRIATPHGLVAVGDLRGATA